MVSQMAAPLTLSQSRYGTTSSSRTSRMAAFVAAQRFFQFFASSDSRPWPVRNLPRFVAGGPFESRDRQKISPSGE
jgi:hypothetical protein